MLEAVLTRYPRILFVSKAMCIHSGRLCREIDITESSKEVQGYGTILVVDFSPSSLIPDWIIGVPMLISNGKVNLGIDAFTMYKKLSQEGAKPINRSFEAFMSSMQEEQEKADGQN